MEVTALCFRLLMLEFTMLWAQVETSYSQKCEGALCVTPNSLQHFQLNSISFNCGGSDGLTQLRAIKSNKAFEPGCYTTSNPAVCTIDRVYQTDTGEYWCETKAGQRSNTVNITVTAGSVILEIPALLVLEGESVTLHCRNKTLTQLQANFYKDGLLINSSLAQKMTINNVSKFHEGLYKCKIFGGEVSPESWLAVKAKNYSNNPDSPHVLILLLVVVPTLMVVLVLLVVGFLHIINRVSSKTPEAASNSVEDNKIDEDESSFQLAYSALTFGKTPQACQHTEAGLSSSTTTLNPTAANNPISPMEEVTYSTVKKATTSEAT